MIYKKLFSLIVTGAILLSAAACAASETDETAGSTESEITTGETETETTEISDDLPDDVDYEGKSFRIGLWSGYDVQRDSILIDEATGDIVTDSIYEANQKVMERFDIKFETYYYDNAALTDVSATVMAGDDAYDIVGGHDISMANLSISGIYMDIAALPHIDLTKPWWPRFSVDSLSVNGHMMLISNYISTICISWTAAIFMNKKIFADKGLELPYDSVFDGSWTLDRLIDIAKGMYTDLNGNGIRDAEDQYSIGIGEPYQLQESFGCGAIAKDSDGKLCLAINDERIVNVVSKLRSLLYGSGSGCYYPAFETRPSFTNIMMTTGSLSSASDSLRYTDIDYGILPVPKYDEAQDSYISGTGDRPYAVPITEGDTDFTGMIIEAMSAEGYKLVRPALFEIALKNKYTYDSESARVLDIIGDTVLLDFGYMYSDYGCMAFTLIDLIKPESNGDFASYYAKNESKALKRIAKIQAFFDSLN